MVNWRIVIVLLCCWQFSAAQVVVVDKVTARQTFTLNGDEVVGISTDGGFSGASDDSLATQLAVKTYVDAVVTEGTTEEADGVTILGDGSGGDPFRVNTDSLHSNIVYFGIPAPSLLPCGETSDNFNWLGVVVDDSIRVGDNITSLIDETAEADIAIVGVTEWDGYAILQMNGTLSAGSYLPEVEYKGEALWSEIIVIEEQDCSDVVNHDTSAYFHRRLTFGTDYTLPSAVLDTADIISIYAGAQTGTSITITLPTLSDTTNDGKIIYVMGSGTENGDIMRITSPDSTDILVQGCGAGSVTGPDTIRTSYRVLYMYVISNGRYYRTCQRPNVNTITYVPDTTNIDAHQGDMFVNGTRDTMGLYDPINGWVLFYGGGADTDWAISNDTLISGADNVNIGSANMPTSGSIFSLQDEMAIFKDGFNGNTNFFFGDIAGWSTAAGGAAYNLANNFHAWWDDADDIRIEYENNAGPMQFYIEGLNEAWYGLQNGATHLWSFGYDNAVDGSTFNFNNGFGIDASPAMSLTTTGELSVFSAISVDGDYGNAAAAIEIQSTDKGFLPARMTTAQRDAISSPTTSLSIYNSTTKSNQYKAASGWATVAALPSVSTPSVATSISIDLNNLSAGVFNMDFSSFSEVAALSINNPINGGEYKFWVEGCSNDTITFPNNFLSRDRDSLKTRLCTTNEIIDFFYDGANYITEDTIWNPVTAIGGDATSPSLTAAFTASGQDSVIVLDYNEALNESSVPATGDFSLSGGVSVASVSVSNDSVFIYSATPYTCDSTITVSYTAGVNPIEDLSGNDAANLTNQAVTNNITGCAGADSLLNEYTGAIAAYSLQIINSSYSGDVVLVRRSSDNAEQGFTAAEVTDGTLTTFTGAGDGFVVTWYDITGNANHLTQDTTTLQPQIVSSGSLITKNGKAALRMSSDKLRTGRLLSGTSWSIFSVASFDAVSVNATAETVCAQHNGLSDANRTVFIQLRRITSDNGYATFLNNGSSYTGRHSATPTTDQKILTSIADGTNVDFAVNGSLEEVITGQSVTPLNNNFTLGAYSNNISTMTGYVQELVIYASDQGANRTGIEGNMNDRYGTY